MSIKIIASVTLGVQPITREVRPLLSGFRINEDVQNYQYSKSTRGNLIFYNKNKIQDFDFIRQCETTDPTAKISIDVYIDNVLQFSGFFYPIQTSINLDRCTAEVSLTVDDVYNCITSYWSTKENVLFETSPAERYRIPNPIRLITFVCKQVMLVETLNTLPVGQPVYNHAPDFIPLNLVNTPNVLGLPIPEWDSAYMPFIGMNAAYFCFPQWFNTGTGVAIANAADLKKTLRVIKSTYTHLQYQGTWNNPFTAIDCQLALTEVTTTWGAEVITSLNDPATGVPVPPVGAGWVEYKNTLFGGLPATIYLRIAYYNNQDYKYFTSEQTIDYRVYELISPYINDAANTYFMNRGRGLREVMQMFLDKAGCGLQFYSKFFQDTINPVTGLLNKVQRLILNQCSDFKDYPTTNPATIMYLTLNELLDNLAALFNVAWHIDGQYFRVEHISYFKNNYNYVQQPIQAKDLTAVTNRLTGKSEILATSSYVYDKDNIYSQERWRFTQKNYQDFFDSIIKYDVQIKDKINERSIDFITDVSGLFNFESQYNSEGIVLVAVEWQRIDPVNFVFDWVIINETGNRSGELVVNGHLCLSNLIDVYWQHGRVFIEGLQDELPKTFLSELNKKLQTVTVSDCGNEYQANDIVSTFLDTGQVVSTEWDIERSTKTLTIRI